jgi:hypothetical protein
MRVDGDPDFQSRYDGCCIFVVAVMLGRRAKLLEADKANLSPLTQPNMSTIKHQMLFVTITITLAV